MTGFENLKKSETDQNERKSLILGFLSRSQPYFREKSHLQALSEFWRIFRNLENFDILAHMRQL